MSSNDKVALVVEGKLQNRTEVILGTAMRGKDKVYMSKKYPEGQHLRGAFGYAFLYGGAEVIESYREDRPKSHPAIYFRDARPVHFEDGGDLVPVVVKRRFVNYRCSRCGKVLRFPTFMQPVTSIKLDRRTNTVARGAGFVKNQAITRKSNFSFRAALNLKRGEEYAPELIAAVEKFASEGMRLGKRRSKGKGLFELKDLGYSTVDLGEIRERAGELREREELVLRLMSDTVVDGEGAITESMLLRSIKKAAKFWHPEYEPYSDPFVKMSVDALPPQSTVFLDRKEGVGAKTLKAKVVPRGATVRLQPRDAPGMFYEALAIAEAFMGIGKRISSGKGEFAVV